MTNYNKNRFLLLSVFFLLLSLFLLLLCHLTGEDLFAILFFFLFPISITLFSFSLQKKIRKHLNRKANRKASG